MKYKLHNLTIVSVVFGLLLSMYFAVPVKADDWRSDIPDTSVYNLSDGYESDDGYYRLDKIYLDILIDLEDYLSHLEDYDEDDDYEGYEDCSIDDMVTISTSSSNFLCVRENYSIVLYAKKAGSYTYTITINGVSVTANVIVISIEDDSINLLKGKTYQITGGKTSDYLAFTTSDKSVATVSSSGKITAKGVGTAEICAYSVSGSKKTCIGYIDVYVSNPKISATSVSLNIYNTYKSGSYYYPSDNYVKLSGLSGNSNVTVKSSSSNLKCEADTWSSYTEISFYPKKTGTYTVTVNADGKKFSVKVKVFKMYFALNSKNIVQEESKWDSDSCILLYKGDTAKLKVKGISSSTKVKYKSSNKKVAKVNSSGKITAKGLGTATITATANGNSISYNVEVSYKKAVLACRSSKKNYPAKYSQSKRMSSGYYDCSSWVWRSYKAAKVYVGSSKSWAPTAADMAKWCVDNGYMIYDVSTSGYVDVSKLLAGDLIFSCGSDNGRYKGIYHVDLYQGNYTATSVYRIKYYGGSLSGVMIARPCGTKNATPKISSTSKRKIKLSWSASYKADGYQIYRSTSKNGKYKRVATVKSKTTYTDTGLKSKKTYYYKVRPYWKNSKGKKKYGKFSTIVSKKAK